MIDLHTHTILSDGALIPAEHIRRAEVAGYRILGMSDHVDLATIPVIMPQLVEAAKRESELGRMKVLAGAELTHVRPEHIAEATALARKYGAQYIIVHGETIAEPVQPGTNRAAIEAGVDILAHPGLISEKDVALAAVNNVMLEISGKNGHCLTNGHVAAIAKKHGAQLIFGSDAHGPENLRPLADAQKVLLGASIGQTEIDQMFRHAQDFAIHCIEQSEADNKADW